jgi:Predicted nucleic acid-binding protein, contains PIN domain
MKPAILDTDILLDILHGRSEIVRKHAQRYREVYKHYTISAVTVAELTRGSLRQGNSPAWLEQVLTQVEVLPLDTASAQLAGRVYGELERAGLTIGLADSLIAGIALAHNRVLVTGNVRHFQRVAELGYPLEIVNWREVG